MSQAGKTTVVITTHNYGRYVAECIGSALSQTVRPSQIIVVDDASEDDTRQQIEPYLGEIEYHRVDYRNAQKTRNFGLERVSSEYVLFLDADNRIAETMVQKLEHALDSHPSARVAYCDKHVFGDPAAMRRLGLSHYWQADDFSLELLRFRNVIDTTSLVRRKFLTEFDERIRRLQDWDTWLTTLQADDHAVRVPEPLLHYRVHGENLSLRREELLERLKVLAKHGLIAVEPFAGNGAQRAGRGQKVVVTIEPRLSDSKSWKRLAEKHGWRLRAIVGSLQRGSAAAVVRDGNVIVQVAPSDSLDDLLWRHAGVVSADGVDATIVTRDANNIPASATSFQTAQPMLRCRIGVQDMLSAQCWDELGTLVLSPSATRLLLYLPPAVPLTFVQRLRQAVALLLSEHVTWRLRRKLS
jgi:glycosyltransferase involved in cell wall biosynthesis